MAQRLMMMARKYLTVATDLHSCNCYPLLLSVITG